MTDRIRIRIAALVTALFIGGLSIAGIGLRHHSVAQSTASVQSTASAQSTASVQAQSISASGETDDE